MPLLRMTRMKLCSSTRTSSSVDINCFGFSGLNALKQAALTR